MLAYVVETYGRTVKNCCILVIVCCITQVSLPTSKSKQLAYLTASCGILAAKLDGDVLWKSTEETLLTALLFTFFANNLPRNILGMVTTGIAVDGLIVSLIIYVLPVGMKNQSEISQEIWYKSMVLGIGGVLFDDLQSIFHSIETHYVNNAHLIFNSCLTFTHTMILFYYLSCLEAAGYY